MDGPDFGELRETLDEHAPALQRYALLVTGDTARAADVVGETMLRARRDPQLVGAPAPSVRASLFITARRPNSSFAVRSGLMTLGTRKSTPPWTGCCSATRWRSCPPTIARWFATPITKAAQQHR